MLRHMKTDGVIYYQMNRNFKVSNGQLQAPEQIKPFFEALRISESEKIKGWLTIAKSTDNPATSLLSNSIYPKLDGYIDTFFDEPKVLSKINRDDKSYLVKKYPIQSDRFFYSMHWALQTMSVFDRIMPNQSDVLRGIDLGGGFGFQSAELATRGHECENLEINSFQGEAVGSWLAKTCDVKKAGLEFPLAEWKNGNQMRKCLILFCVWEVC